MNTRPPASQSLVTSEWLAAFCPPLPTPWPPAARAALVSLLGSGPGLLPAWETSDRYGLAGMESVGSWGWGGAYGTSYRVDPVERMTTVLMVQMIPNNTDLADKFKASIYQALID